MGVSPWGGGGANLPEGTGSGVSASETWPRWASLCCSDQQ